VQVFIVDLNQFVITCESDDEAHYFCGMLNSRRVNEAITADQTADSSGRETYIGDRSSSSPSRGSTRAKKTTRRSRQLSRQMHVKCGGDPL